MDPYPELQAMNAPRRSLDLELEIREVAYRSPHRSWIRNLSGSAPFYPGVGILLQYSCMQSKARSHQIWLGQSEQMRGSVVGGRLLNGSLLSKEEHDRESCASSPASARTHVPRITTLCERSFNPKRPGQKTTNFIFIRIHARCLAPVGWEGEEAFGQPDELYHVGD